MQVVFRGPKKIEALAQATLSNYRGRYGGGLPIKVEQFLETAYGVTILPLPGARGYNIDCSLSLDGKTVLVDERSYLEAEGPLYLRTRFSFAHEVGHLELHRSHLPPIPPHDYSELTGFLSNFDAAVHGRMETQANMFAAQFLMPAPDVRGALAAKIVQNLDLLRDNGIRLWDYAFFIAPVLALEFGVSEKAMKFRLKNFDYSELTMGKTADVLIAECDLGRLRSLSSAEGGANMHALPQQA